MYLPDEKTRSRRRRIAGVGAACGRRVDADGRRRLDAMAAVALDGEEEVVVVAEAFRGCRPSVVMGLSWVDREADVLSAVQQRKWGKYISSLGEDTFQKIKWKK